MTAANLSASTEDRKRIFAPADSYETTIAAVRALAAGGRPRRAKASAEQFGWTATPYVLALLAQEGEA